MSFDTEKFLFIQNCNLRIFASKLFEGIGISQNVIANISISMSSEKFSPHYQSGFQLVSSVFNGIETNALLGTKIWDLVLLEVKQKNI